MTPDGFKLAVPTGTAGRVFFKCRRINTRTVENFNAMTHRRLQMAVYLIKTEICFQKKMLTHGLSFYTLLNTVTLRRLNIIMDMGRFQTVAFLSKILNIFNAEQKVNETMFHPLHYNY